MISILTHKNLKKLDKAIVDGVRDLNPLLLKGLINQ